MPNKDDFDFDIDFNTTDTEEDDSFDSLGGNPKTSKDDFEDSFGNIEDLGMTLKTKANNNPNSDTSAVKKTALIGAIAGFIIIVIALIIISSISKHNKEKITAINTSAPVETVESVIIQPSASATPVAANLNGWVAFTDDSGIVIDTEINSNFTVTSITHLAKVVNDKKDMLVKSIVTGNVSGLVGTYEIEIPYQTAKLLKVGNTFDIKYMISSAEGVKVVGDIKY